MARCPARWSGKIRVVTLRLVVISTALGHDLVPHAGGRYLYEVDRVARQLSSVTFMVPGTRSNRDAARLAGAPQHVIPLGLEPERRLVWKAMNRLALVLDRHWRKVDPGMPYLPLFVGLLRSPQAREEIRRADVIDLQWSDSIRLVHLLRRLNPRARIVGTFHDVMSQSFSREPQDTPQELRYWQGIARRSRRHERRMVRALDYVLVFSEKDAELLGSPAHARVVRPPVGGGAAPVHTPAEPGSGTVLVVSHLPRDENNKAAHWTIDNVWPLVRSRLPDAELRFVGGGALPSLVDRAASESQVTLTGFVDDLAGEYAAASVALVPVLQGAGVKFKTLEALLHGVPLVSTAVGLEGIDAVELAAGVHDDPHGLADALVGVLEDPTSWQPRADAAQTWAAAHYSREGFAEALREVWVKRDRVRE